MQNRQQRSRILNLLLWSMALAGCLAVACGQPNAQGNNEPATNTKFDEDTMKMANQAASATFLEQVLQAHETAIGNSEQLVVVTSTEHNATDVRIRTYEKSDDGWAEMMAEAKGSIGHKGFAPYGQKREGDKKSPTGIFDLGPAFGYEPSAGTTMPYLQATENDFWIDDPDSDDYNRWVTQPTPPKMSHEKMLRADDLYSLGLVIQYNTANPVPGHGSAIFMHLEKGPGATTAGCVATNAAALSGIVSWLNPERFPVVIMGTEEDVIKAFP